MMSYLERAEHCERMALIVADPDAKARFVQLARLWRGLATPDEPSAEQLLVRARTDAGDHCSASIS
jgi:hypothetical protein